MRYRKTFCQVIILTIGMLAIVVSTTADATSGKNPITAEFFSIQIGSEHFTAFRDCKRCPEMIKIPTGAFFFGSSSLGGEPSGSARTEIKKTFAISRYEIRWDEWLACVRDDFCERIPSDHGWGRGDMPIINITWHEANNYADYLSKKTGRNYRLPTEVEWEYAAKAGTKSSYWWGDSVGLGNANCRRCGTPWDGKGSSPVGSFAPNPFGLFDMNGNVWEWTADCWSLIRNNNIDAAVSSKGSNCKNRVIKSGSWYYIPRLITAEARDRYPAQLFSYNIGIRVIIDYD